MLSVIIPTCNRNDLLKDCLDCLHPSVQTISSVEYEVIVTDDSKDNIARKLVEEHYPWVTWIEGCKRGPAANRNNGVKHASSKWLVFVDDDCLPQEDWLLSYWNEIQKQDLSVFEGKTIADRRRQRFDEEAPINLEGNNLWSCNFAIKKDFFMKVGGFDEAFPYPAMEDVDFYTRVSEHSSVVFVPGALVIHPWRRIKPFRSFKKHLKSHKYFAKKYNLLTSFDFRWGRAKIFLGSVFIDFKQLARFSMKGWLIYVERCLFNFCMIFI